VIKIRYRDPDELSPGLHAAAEAHGRNTTVFLLPGLTAAERRAALRRLRLSARRGYSPPLPATQLALALAADRIRTTVGQVGTLIRSHPAGSTVPVMVLSAGAIAFLALSAVSIQVLHVPRDPGRSALAITAGGPPSGTPSPAPPQAQPAGPADPDPGLVSSTTPAPASSPGSLPSATSSLSPPAGVTPTDGSSSPAPSPEPPPMTAAPTPSPTGSTAMQRPTPTPSQSSCLHMGPLGLCP